MQATYENPNLALGVKEFVEEVKYNRSFPEDTYEAARAVLSKIQAGQSFKDDVSRNDYDVPVNGKRFVPVRIVRRTELEDALPVIFYVHGGGWVLGDAMVYDRLLRKLAKGSYGAVVFVDYTHAPEVRFPTQLEELWAVLTHMLNNPGMYRINPYKLVMAGGVMTLEATSWAFRTTSFTYAGCSTVYSVPSTGSIPAARTFWERNPGNAALPQTWQRKNSSGCGTS